jgi:glyoxylase-like metal-dependent hydrolase (beta-lactamase superfamily II)
MKVIRFENSILKSNSYIVYFEKSEFVFVVDPGDSELILKWVKNNKKYIIGILITHSHFDHIYGVNDLHSIFPNMTIYSSIYSIDGMFSAKINGSYYAEMPFVINCENLKVVDENDSIQLFENYFARVFYTPGHNHDCLSFEIQNYLFTGDAFIPGIKVHTKSKHADKLKSKESINRIFNQFNNTTIICPGHGEICELGVVDISKSYAL